MKSRRVGGVLLMSAVLTVLCGCSLFRSAGGPKTLELSQIRLNAPASTEARRYLGLKDKRSFALSEIDAKFIVLGYYGVQCPFCHEQAPIANKIYDMIRKDPELNGDVKMIGVMLGANPKETEAYAASFHIPYPMTNDPLFEIYRKLGKTNVPLTLLLTRDGRILLSKTGAMADAEGFVKRLKKLHQG